MSGGGAPPGSQAISTSLNIRLSETSPQAHGAEQYIKRAVPTDSPFYDRAAAYFDSSAMAVLAASTDEPAVTFFRAAMAWGFISLAL